jgi:glycosyltransferase involved in cell wall biosynthesis
MPPYYNGTTTCTLGLLDGFQPAATDWHVSVLVKPDAKNFHRLPERYPNWTILDHPPGGRFSMVLRLSQPWDVQTLMEIHGWSLFNFFLMLDTISWDIMYNGTTPVVLDTTWRFLTEYADGIMYISDFSHQRFLSRFPPHPLVRHYVSYLPFHQDDYRKGFRNETAGEGYLLVMGNPLDHKWVSQTVDLLATAFPFHSVHACGCGDLRLPNVKSLPSGEMSEQQIEEVFAGARLVVFPSFYEGFGLPILQGLSHGKPVVARASSLLEEIAARCRSAGTLHPFSTPLELMAIVNGLLNGEPVASLPLGSALADGEEPMRWRDIARNMLDFMQVALQAPGNPQWLRRMHSIQSLRGWRI